MNPQRYGTPPAAILVFAILGVSGCDPGGITENTQPIPSATKLEADQEAAPQVQKPPDTGQKSGISELVVCDCACEGEGCTCKPMRGGGCVCGDADFQDCDCTCSGQEVIPISKITGEFIAERRNAGLSPPPPEEPPSELPPKPVVLPPGGDGTPGSGPVPVTPEIPVDVDPATSE